MQDYQAPEKLLKDKVILVTGAGAGIGRMASIEYAKHGATVILLDKALPLLEQVYDEIEEAGYPQAAIFPMDFKLLTNIFLSQAQNSLLLEPRNIRKSRLASRKVSWTMSDGLTRASSFLSSWLITNSFR